VVLAPVAVDCSTKIHLQLCYRPREVGEDYDQWGGGTNGSLIAGAEQDLWDWARRDRTGLRHRKNDNRTAGLAWFGWWK
jgi:hypothetical protein